MDVRGAWIYYPDLVPYSRHVWWESEVPTQGLVRDNDDRGALIKATIRHDVISRLHGNIEHKKLYWILYLFSGLNEQALFNMDVLVHYVQASY